MRINNKIRILIALMVLALNYTYAQDMASVTDPIKVVNVSNDSTIVGAKKDRRANGLAKRTKRNNMNNDDKTKSGSKDKQKGDELYERLGYKASVDQYKKLNSEEANDRKIMANIANSYRLNHDTENAEFWYSRFIDLSLQADHLLHYAQVLQSNGKCELAVEWYGKYMEQANEADKGNRSFIRDCAEAEAIIDHKNVTVENVASLNTKHLDFMTIPYGDGVMITSTRGHERLIQTRDNWTEDNFTDLYYAAKKADGSFEEPVNVFGDINDKYHDGVPTFNQGESIMYFTRNDYDKKGKNDLIDLKIYESSKAADGYWSEPVELPFNNDESTTCHPTLSNDGKRMYFASNRPGGFGGLDIWVSHFLNSRWGEPQNLGSVINSSGNELFPHISNDGKLYYASNGFVGVGGLDIYRAERTVIENEESWDFRENIGKPFNSKKDDFGLVFNEDDISGYFTSSRKGGQGNDDIYTWKRSGAAMESAFNRNICVFEMGTDLRIEDASVTVIEGEDGNQCQDLMLTLKPNGNNDKEYVLTLGKDCQDAGLSSLNYKTNERGIFPHKIKNEKTYTILVEKMGYKSQRQEVTFQELMNNDNYCIPLEKKTCKAVEGIVMNTEYNRAMPNTKVMVLDRCTGEESEVTTDSKGAFNFCVECDCEYRFAASKKRFNSNHEFLDLTDGNCDNKTSLELVLDMVIVDENVFEQSQKTVNDPADLDSNMDSNMPGIRYQNGIKYQAVTTLQPVTTYVPADQAHLYRTRAGIQASAPSHVTTYPTHTSAKSMTPDMLKTHFLGSSKTEFREGQVIKLKDIYYDFNKFNIRDDATADLEKLAMLMNTYPSMEVMLMSHTDSRGKDAYNETLSTNRAKEAMDYLIKSGISANRLQAKGFGETQLVNECRDGIDCSELEHQQNRRTEVKITRCCDSIKTQIISPD